MSFLKRLLLFAAIVLVAPVLYLLLWPTPINPAGWNPTAAPLLTGPYQQNSRLAGVERLSLGDGRAPEDVALDAAGRIYAGFDDGRIIQLQANGTQPRVFANTQGRPLGLIFNHAGDLIVADAIKGLLSINPSGEVQLLSDGADGVKFGCANDLDVAADDTIYFTDASARFPMSQFTSDLLEHQPNGRLLVFDPRTRQSHTLVKDLYFANGVAVSPDQSFVLVVETGEYRVRRVWLQGPKQGQSETFIDNLPGFPDGILSNGKDKFWLALVTPRDEMFDRMLPHPFVRKMVYRLPKFMQPAPKRYSFVLALSLDGKVVENLQNPAPDCYAEITNVVERDGKLYFGSIGENTVGRFTLR
ncbi:MAG TPA: SMP-30/gluconolactonase/LRE family protein [Pyrinomonadaceae bacterium]|nr:SMP-30/gluconolactonase/LRE family protein [Pyrinomonadaceae bacterium]